MSSSANDGFMHAVEASPAVNVPSPHLVAPVGGCGARGSPPSPVSIGGASAIDESAEISGEFVSCAAPSLGASLAVSLVDESIAPSCGEPSPESLGVSDEDEPEQAIAAIAIAITKERKR